MTNLPFSFVISISIQNFCKNGLLGSIPEKYLFIKGESRAVHRISLLFLVLHPPEEVPSSEDWFTQSLGRIISHEMHISPYFQEVFLCHSLLCKMTVLGEVLSEVATIQYLCQQQLSSLFIHRSNHLLLR